MQNGKLRRMVFIAGAILIAGPARLSADPKADFDALEERMEAAHAKFLEAGDHEVRDGDGHRNPSAADERLKILTEMDALAGQSAAAPGGDDIAVRTFIWSAQLELDVKRLPARFERVAVDHSGSEAVVEAVAALPDVYRLAGSAESWNDSLRRLADRTERGDVRRAALLARGTILLDAGMPAEARKSFDELVKLDPSSEEARLAKGYVFEIEHLQVGMAAPDFTARTLDGQEIALKSLRGKAVLLDFWATWCGQCLAETPRLKAAAERFNDRPFVILAVSLDDIREILESTLEQKGLPGVQTWDEKGRDNPIGELYNVQSLPQWYLIDAEGVIRARNPFGEKLAPAVEKILPK